MSDRLLTTREVGGGAQRDELFGALGPELELEVFALELALPELHVSGYPALREVADELNAVRRRLEDRDDPGLTICEVDERGPAGQRHACTSTPSPNACL